MGATLDIRLVVPGEVDGWDGHELFEVGADLRHEFVDACGEALRIKSSHVCTVGRSRRPAPVEHAPAAGSG
jgi:hypothetical protein